MILLCSTAKLDHAVTPTSSRASHKQISFLLNLHIFLLSQNCKITKGFVLLPHHVLLDLRLWKKILTSLSSRGRSINLVTYTLPHFFLKQDACPDSLGGIIDIGLAWRYIIPGPLRRLVHINILEFLAVVITT